VEENIESNSLKTVDASGILSRRYDFPHRIMDFVLERRVFLKAFEGSLRVSDSSKQKPFDSSENESPCAWATSANKPSKKAEFTEARTTRFESFLFNRFLRFKNGRSLCPLAVGDIGADSEDLELRLISVIVSALPRATQSSQIGGAGLIKCRETGRSMGRVNVVNAPLYNLIQSRKQRFHPG
jgi:predicted molibdopterin-dependent oxidoreductase YjgC